MLLAAPRICGRGKAAAPMLFIFSHTELERLKQKYHELEMYLPTMESLAI